MRRPDWLQELRDLLALKTYEARQAAMDAWEARRLVELHCVRMVSREEQEFARFNILELTEARVRADIGKALADLMVDITIQACADINHKRSRHHWLEGGTEVRGDVLAIRWEPKDAD